jgi:hypothetical protein
MLTARRKFQAFVPRRCERFGPKTKSIMVFVGTNRRHYFRLAHDSGGIDYFLKADFAVPMS